MSASDQRPFEVRTMNGNPARAFRVLARREGGQFTGGQGALFRLDLARWRERRAGG